jgi:hypothetical protein
LGNRLFLPGFIGSRFLPRTAGHDGGEEHRGDTNSEEVHEPFLHFIKMVFGIGKLNRSISAIFSKYDLKFPPYQEK